jgi:hypothetical protein
MIPVAVTPMSDPLRTDGARGVLWPKGNASQKSCCRTVLPLFSAVITTKLVGCCRRRSTAAHLRRKL